MFPSSQATLCPGVVLEEGGRVKSELSWRIRAILILQPVPSPLQTACSVRSNQRPLPPRECCEEGQCVLVGSCSFSGEKASGHSTR